MSSNTSNNVSHVSQASQGSDKAPESDQDPDPDAYWKNGKWRKNIDK
jgi:hypothetical protein